MVWNGQTVLLVVRLSLLTWWRLGGLFVDIDFYRATFIQARSLLWPLCLSVTLSDYPSRCHTRALCPNVWYSPIFIVCGPPHGIGVPKTGRVWVIPILTNNRLYLTNGTTYQARRQGVPWVRPTPSPCDGASRLNDDDHVFSCVHSATNTNRYGARLWATCNLQAVWLNVVRNSESGFMRRACPSVRLHVYRQNAKKREFLKN